MNKVALVTGGTGGLGQNIVRGLCESGITTVIHYCHREKEAISLADELNAQGGRAVVGRADVANEAEVERLVADTIEDLGRIDILVNNAGISKAGLSWKLSANDWNDVLNTNLTGSFFMARAVLPHMRKTEWGRIVNISSVVSQTGVPGTVAYAASKAGLAGLTRVLAREVASKGITVNCLVLGYYDVGLIDLVPAEMREEIVDQVPLGRLGSPATVSETIRYLCSDEAGYVTGQLINLNGGLFMG